MNTYTQCSTIHYSVNSSHNSSRLTNRMCEWTLTVRFFTRRNEVVAKVIFLHLSVILFTGVVCLSACWDTTPPAGSRHPPEQTPIPREQTPPWEQTTPREQTHPPGSRPPGRRPPGADTPQSVHPPGADTSPESRHLPPPSRLRHTVNERPVRILLECILVHTCLHSVSYLKLRHCY